MTPDTLWRLERGAEILFGDKIVRLAGYNPDDIRFGTLEGIPIAVNTRYGIVTKVLENEGAIEVLLTGPRKQDRGRMETIQANRILKRTGRNYELAAAEYRQEVVTAASHRWKDVDESRVTDGLLITKQDVWKLEYDSPKNFQYRTRSGLYEVDGGNPARLVS
jgi:hypothetical protein